MVEQKLTNSIYKYILKLKNTINTKDKRITFSEGKNILISCIEKKIRIIYLVINIKEKHKYLDIIKNVDNSIVYYADEDILTRLSTTKTSYSCLTVFELPEIISYIDEHDLKKIETEIDFINQYLKNKNYVCAFFNISDPGNLGTIIRTSLGFSQNTIILFSPHSEPFSPKVIRSSSGAIFGLKRIISVNFNLIDLFLKLIKDRNIKITFAQKEEITNRENTNILNYENCNKEPKIIIFGNEGRGIPENLESFKDYSISIPQSNDIESYNLSVSHAIISYILSKKN